jgi:hypothetical protein
VADCTAADALLDQMPAAVILNGDKGVRTFLVSAKWNLRLNGDWIVAFNPTEGLEARFTELVECWQ